MRILKLAAAAVFALGTFAGSAIAKDWKEIKIGTEGAYPPFNSLDASGQLVGFDIDIGNAVCEKIKAKCTWVAQDWDGIIPALLAGKYDVIIASMSITDERKQKVAFTAKYYNTPPVMVAAKTLKAGDFGPEAMKGKTIGTQSSTIHANFLEEVYKPAGVEVKLYPTQDEANADLAAGRLDAVVADVIALEDWLKKPEGACCDKKVIIDTAKYQKILGEGAGFAARPDDKELVDLLNKGLGDIIVDGTYKKINDKYFPFSIY